MRGVLDEESLRAGGGKGESLECDVCGVNYGAPFVDTETVRDREIVTPGYNNQPKDLTIQGMQFIFFLKEIEDLLTKDGVAGGMWLS